MGGQDLLPPAKAGGARRTSRSTPVRLTVLTSALIIACLLYTAQRTHRPDMVVVAYPVDHNHGIEALAGQHDSASPPPSLRPVTEAPAEAAAAAEAAAITVASPSIISLKLQTTSGKEHTLRLRLLPEHSAPSVEFMRCACTAHAHAPHARHTHGTRTTAHAPRHTHGWSAASVVGDLRHIAALSAQVCRHPQVWGRAVSLGKGLSRAGYSQVTASTTWGDSLYHMG